MLIIGELVLFEVVLGMEVYGGVINFDGLLCIEIICIGEVLILGKVIGLM